MNAEQEVPRDAGSLRDGIFLGGGSSWRKELVNVTVATSTFPIKRLGELRPLLLLEFHPNTPGDTVDWLLGRILAAESLGGADLLGRVIGLTLARGPMVVVGAPPERLLLEADEDLLFRHKPFCSLQGVPRGAGQAAGLCGMLSSAECIMLLQRILGKLRVGDWEEVQLFPSMRLLPGEAVMTALVRSKVLTDCYPLHDATLLHSLKAHWGYPCFGLWPQTHAQHRLLLEEIRAYFGESLAAYVGFEGELVSSLLLKSILSAFLFFYPLQLGCGLLFYSLSSVLWSEIFLQGWRRRSEARVKDWSTVMTHVPHSQSAPPSPSPSPSSGPAGSPVVADPGPVPTHQKQDYLLGELSWTRLLHSLSFLIGILFLSCTLLLNYLHFSSLLKEVLARQEDTISPSLCHILFFLPEVALTLAMAGVDRSALWLSRCLSPGLGREGQPSPFPPSPPPAQRHHLLPELVFSRLVNHFAVHFYRALVLRDFHALRRHLAVQLATRLSLKLLSASLAPCLLRATRESSGRTNQHRQPPVLRQIQDQSLRPECGSQTWSYLELVLSYCHVMFFSGVYPQCALWCLLTVVAQSRLDAWRLCAAQRRPFPQHSWEGVGVWEQVFGGLEVLAVLLNSMLLWVSPEFSMLFHSFSQWKVLKAFLLLQFILLATRAVLSALLHSLGQASSRQAEQLNPRHPRHPWLHRQQSPPHQQS